MVPVRSLLALLRDGKSDWFDDITTNKKESMDDILKASISDAVENIEKTIGSNTDEWKWSAVHTLTHNHTLGVVKILDKVFSFNVGPYPAGGSAGTINKGEYILLSNYDKTIGPSMRRIVDFDNLNNTQFILPTGQSGIPTSPHYKDQAPMYNKGEYRTTYFDEDFIRSASQFRHLKLGPGE
jgi:penicillin amidase